MRVPNFQSCIDSGVELREERGRSSFFHGQFWHRLGGIPSVGLGILHQGTFNMDAASGYHAGREYDEPYQGNCIAVGELLGGLGIVSNVSA